MTGYLLDILSDYIALLTHMFCKLWYLVVFRQAPSKGS